MDFSFKTALTADERAEAEAIATWERIQRLAGGARRDHPFPGAYVEIDAQLERARGQISGARGQHRLDVARRWLQKFEEISAEVARLAGIETEKRRAISAGLLEAFKAQGSGPQWQHRGEADRLASILRSKADALSKTGHISSEEGLREWCVEYSDALKGLIASAAETQLASIKRGDASTSSTGFDRLAA